MSTASATTLTDNTPPVQSVVWPTTTGDNACVPVQPAPCPTCGTCPTCGRAPGTAYAYPAWYAQPYPQIQWGWFGQYAGAGY